LNGFKNVNFVEVIKEGGKDEKWFINTFKYEDEPLIKFLKFTKENPQLTLEEERSIIGQDIIEGNKVESEKEKKMKARLEEQIEKMLKTDENWKDIVEKMLKRRKSLTRMLTFLEIYNEVEDEIEEKEELRKERNNEEFGEEKKAEILEEHKAEICKEKKRDEKKVRDHKNIGEKGDKEEFGEKKKVEETKIDDKTLEELLNEKVQETYGEELPMEDRERWNHMLDICIKYRSKRKDLSEYMEDIINKKLLDVKKLLEEPLKKNLETLLNFIEYYNNIVNEFANFIETEVKVSSLIFINKTFLLSMSSIMSSHQHKWTSMSSVQFCVKYFCPIQIRCRRTL